MSTLSQFMGGGVKSIQTGYLNVTMNTSGSGEDFYYYDFAVSSVNTAKSIVLLYGTITTGYSPLQLRPRFLSSTSVRLATFLGGGAPTIQIRYHVVEYY